MTAPGYRPPHSGLHAHLRRAEHARRRRLVLITVLCLVGAAGCGALAAAEIGFGLTWVVTGYMLIGCSVGQLLAAATVWRSR